MHNFLFLYLFKCSHWNTLETSDNIFIQYVKYYMYKSLSTIFGTCDLKGVAVVWLIIF